MSQRLFTMMLLFVHMAGFAYAQNGTSTFQPNVKPALEIRRAAGTIQIDGDLNDAGWAAAARVANFAETRPGDQTKPPVETEALITYDDAFFLSRLHRARRSEIDSFLIA